MKLVAAWRKKILGERGDGALGSVISMGLFIFMIAFFVWLILTYYSYRVLASAANDGAAAASAYESTVDGGDHAEAIISQAGARSLVSEVQASQTIEPGLAGEPDRVIVEVSGQAITPFFSMTLSATGSARVERFRPQGEES